jgi:hypothetical protein
MPLQRAEKLSSYFIGTAYVSHGEFSLCYTEMQEGKGWLHILSGKGCDHMLNGELADQSTSAGRRVS